MSSAERLARSTPVQTAPALQSPLRGGRPTSGHGAFRRSDWLGSNGSYPPTAANSVSRRNIRFGEPANPSFTGRNGRKAGMLAHRQFCCPLAGGARRCRASPPKPSASRSPEGLPRLVFGFVPVDAEIAQFTVGHRPEFIGLRDAAPPQPEQACRAPQRAANGGTNDAQSRMACRHPALQSRIGALAIRCPDVSPSGDIGDDRNDRVAPHSLLLAPPERLSRFVQRVAAADSDVLQQSVGQARKAASLLNALDPD